jgi:predicted HTH domain antitoxin
VLPDPNGETRVITLALKRLRELSETERENSRRLRKLDVAAFEASRLSAHLTAPAN